MLCLLDLALCTYVLGCVFCSTNHEPPFVTRPGTADSSEGGGSTHRLRGASDLKPKLRRLHGHTSRLPLVRMSGAGNFDVSKALTGLDSKNCLLDILLFCAVQHPGG